VRADEIFEGKNSERIEQRPLDPRQLLVGEQGIPVGKFLETPIERWVA
jgi:hypothetical protein